MTDPRVRDPRAEATDRLGGGREARVLEPSPPALDVGPWFADRPAGDPDDWARPDVVAPVPTAVTRWEDVVTGDPDLAAFAHDRWLLPRPLPTPPNDLAATRESLRALAFAVLAPARQAANGKIGLRWARGGFATPFFGADRQVRVEGTDLVVQEGATARAAPITTLGAAGALAGVTPGPPPGVDFHDPPPPVDDDAPLTVDPAGAEFLGEWFGFATLVLESLLALAGSPADTRVQLWGEHFDPAVELGDADAGTRASFGASPGDDAIATPYLYVAPWTPRTGELWDAPFGGAALTVDALVAAPDPVAAALAFFDRTRAAPA